MRQESEEIRESGTNREVAITQSSPGDHTPPIFPASALTVLESLPLTDQQRALITTIEECAEELGRMPSAHEVRTKTSDVSISRVSNDRIHRIVRELNGMLPKDVPPLVLTPHRPHLLYRRDVQRVAEEYLREHYELPAPPTLQRLMLEQRGVKVSTTTLKFIMRGLYRSAARGENFSDMAPSGDLSSPRISRKRLAVSWKNIAEAYIEAARYLAKIPANRTPATEEIGHFLRKAGFKIPNGTLKFRLQNPPPSLELKVAPYSDLTPEIIQGCHMRLRRRLRRNPTIHELAQAFNAIAFRKRSPDALWTRIQRLRRGDPSFTITLADTRRSGIYDQDIQRVFTRLNVRHERPPTFNELLTEVRSQKPSAKIREDSFLRRVTKLQLTLTHPFDLKETEQERVRNTIATLRTELRRSPLKEEVLQRCTEQGAPLSGKDLVRVLSTIKKRRSIDDRVALHLASPPVLKGALKQAIRSVNPAVAPDKLLEHVSSQLGWSAAGIYRVAAIIVGSGDKTAGTGEVQADQHNHLKLLVQAQEIVWNEHRDIRETTLELAVAFGRPPLAQEVKGELLSQGNAQTLYRINRTLKTLRGGVYAELQKMLRVGKQPEYEGKLRQLVEDLPIPVDPMSIVSSAQKRFGWTLEGTYEIARSMTETIRTSSDTLKVGSYTQRILHEFTHRIEEEIDRAFKTARGDNGESLGLEDVTKSLAGNQLPYTPDQVTRYLRRRALNRPEGPARPQGVMTTEQRVQQLKEILSHPPLPQNGDDIRSRVRRELAWREEELAGTTKALLREIAEELAGSNAPTTNIGSESKRRRPRAFGSLLALLPPEAWPETIREPLVMRHIIAHLAYRLVEARTRRERDLESLEILAELLEHSHELLKPWELDLTGNVLLGTEATVDQLLSAAEVVWICLSALPSAPCNINQEPFEIRKLEAHWCAEMEILYNEVDSFHGFGHAVKMTELAGILSEDERRQLLNIPFEYRLNGRGYSYLRGKIQDLAKRLGFPQG